MSDARYDLGNGLTIDAEQPDNHKTPELCGKCGVMFYYAGHFCVAEQPEPSKAFKRAIQGYYDGE